MKTILITNDPLLAGDAEAAGVARIMVDLESIGKKERQASRTTFISSHQVEDVARVRAVLSLAELIVRINPWHEGSQAEVDAAVEAGADLIMLPMITQMEQLESFIDVLGGRAQPLPLIETAYSMAHIRDIAAHPAIAELYIGLNDLHLSLGQDFLFEPLACGLLDWTAQQVKDRRKAFGFGGIAAIGGAGELPPERILGEHVRLGSQSVILSSRFCRDIRIEEAAGRRERLVQALNALYSCHEMLCARSPQQQDADARETVELIQALARKCRQARAAQ